jgi:hypothetical protein
MGEYDQLTLEERHALFLLHAAGTAVGEIADCQSASNLDPVLE